MIAKTKNELQAIYDARKQFYGKANVYTLNYNNVNMYVLQSYNTIVATICETKLLDSKYSFYYINKNVDKNKLYSQTTLRHIKEFLKQFYKNIDYVKKDLQENETYFDFYCLHTTNEEIEFEIAIQDLIDNATSIRNIC